MKKVLFYSIKLRALYGPKLVAVTTERGGRWWGRDLRDDLGTSGRAGDLSGRFETIEAGQAVIQEVDGVVIHYSGEKSKLEEARRRLEAAKTQMLKQITTRSPQRGAEMLSVNVVVSEHQTES